jgi:hypothetical protein
MKAQQLFASLLICFNGVSSLHVRQGTKALSRRDVFSKVVEAGLVAGTSVAGLVSPAVAAADDLVPVYFGVGCFWHVQHEFVEVGASTRLALLIHFQLIYISKNMVACSCVCIQQPKL